MQHAPPVRRGFLVSRPPPRPRKCRYAPQGLSAPIPRVRGIERLTAFVKPSDLRWAKADLLRWQSLQGLLDA